MIAHVVDNFFDDPEAERAKALEGTYETVEHRELNYRGICRTEDPVSYERIASKIDAPVDAEWTCFWRRYLGGEESETYIHNDSQIGTVSGIVYLSKPEECNGGTAFWRHKLYGWDAQPTSQMLAPKGLKDSKELWDTVYRDGFDEYKWEMIDYVPMAFNRLILFNSANYHSRYPKEAFGTEIGNARLIKTFFYKPWLKK